MNHVRNTYRRIIISLMVLLGILISLLFLVTFQNTQETYRQYAKESIIDAKKVFLKDTVNNVILNIEQKQRDQASYYKTMCQDIKGRMDRYYALSPASFFMATKEFFGQHGRDQVTVLITRAPGETLIYTNAPQPSSASALRAHMTATYPIVMTAQYGRDRITWGVSQETMDAIVKSEIHDEIHSYQFSNDSYIWVNEVMNYAGGKDYAIRRIHPNLKDTEGAYLSTDMTDIAGNHPYLTELTGVKQNGELFFNYYFQKKNSNVISEKVTYSKLYRKYNWIIAMGVHLDDVQAYVDQTTQRSEQRVMLSLLGVAGIVLLLILAALILFSYLEKWYFQNTNQKLEEDVYKDPLTKLFNRRAAELQLKVAHETFKQTGQNTAVFMIDIDGFKQINDDCGHDKGDYVLQHVGEALNNHIRDTDILSRWGGDEFLLLCHGLKDEDVVAFSHKLLVAVSELLYDCDGISHKPGITVSMGASFFFQSDPDYNATVKRADKALYASKSNGKNQLTIESV